MRIRYNKQSYHTEPFDSYLPQCQLCDLFVEHHRICTREPELVKASNCCWNRRKAGKPIVFRRNDTKGT